MKNGKKNLWKAVKKAAELEADMKNTGWPPDCSGFLYQPKRPKKVIINGDQLLKNGLVKLLKLGVEDS